MSAGEQLVVTITLPSLGPTSTSGAGSTGTLGGGRFGLGGGGLGGLGGGGLGAGAFFRRAAGG